MIRANIFNEKNYFSTAVTVASCIRRTSSSSLFRGPVGEYILKFESEDIKSVH